MAISKVLEKSIEYAKSSKVSFDLANAKSNGEGLPSTGIFIFDKKSVAKAEKHLKKILSPWQYTQFEDSKSASLQFASSDGVIVILRTEYFETYEQKCQQDQLQANDYVRTRYLVGQTLSYFKTYKLPELKLTLFTKDEAQVEAAVLGLEMASYSFVNGRNGKLNKMSVEIFAPEIKLNKNIIERAQALAGAVNLSRHLVNLPPNELGPESYSQILKGLFSKSKNFKVEIWNPERIKKENMHLMLAVGEGAESGPYMVRLRYRPGQASKKRPIAFVGKGITFDSGGLDIKPSSGMRLMKKDMGGSASVAGLAEWTSLMQPKVPIDFYFAIAENAISEKSFRPGDIFQGRNGQSVEIHNTDAEGRLVLADTLDVVVTEKAEHEPEVIINLATLTGAIKVGLGADIAGLFCNDDDLTKKLMQSCHSCGEWVWPMPLFQKYRSLMTSKVASVTNSVDGFGGAITAALFLQTYIKEKKWAHLDIYAWKDSPEGALSESGGNGQMVQSMVNFIKNY